MSAIEDVCYEMSADFAQVDCARIVNDRNLSFGLGFGRNSFKFRPKLQIPKLGQLS